MASGCFQLQQHYANYVAEEEQIENHGDHDRHHQHVRVGGLVHPTLNLVVFRAIEASHKAVRQDDERRSTPAQPDEAPHQFLLRDKGVDEDRVQIETLAQHPRVVGQQEVVQDKVECHTAAL